MKSLRLNLIVGRARPVHIVQLNYWALGPRPIECSSGKDQAKLNLPSTPKDSDSIHWGVVGSHVPKERLVLSNGCEDASAQ